MERDTITDELIVKTYRSKAANMSKTAESLHIGRSTLYRWRSEDKTLDEAMRECEEELLDNAETVLYKQILEGNTTAVIFFLKTKGKRRGYVEEVENKVSVNSFEQRMQELPDLSEDDA